MPLAREIYQEGIRIPPVRIMRAGKMERDVLVLLLNNVRTPDEREGDLGAQIAACHTGAERLREVCQRYALDHDWIDGVQHQGFRHDAARTYSAARPIKTST